MVGGLGAEMRWKRRLIGTTVCVSAYIVTLINLGMQLIDHAINMS